MERIDPAQLSDAIRPAPGWARVGLTAPSEKLREQAVVELATAISEYLIPRVAKETNQLALPL